eukprot:g36961.t1
MNYHPNQDQNSDRTIKTISRCYWMSSDRCDAFHLLLGRPVGKYNLRMPDAKRKELQEELIDSILEVLKKNPQLHYYQGYHDIVVTFLLVV